MAYEGLRQRMYNFTRDGKSYTKQGTGREFIRDFDEEVRRIRAVTPGLPIPAAQYEEIIETCATSIARHAPTSEHSWH
jgi:hypothetical protein